MNALLYATFPSNFGNFTIIWKEVDIAIKIQRVFLSDQKLSSEAKTMEAFIKIKTNSSSVINLLGIKIQQFLNGEEVIFDLKLLDFSICSEIQQRVLLAEYKIPRGCVSTYKRIANQIGITKGARVVGNSLAKNPFPIFIPCHRAIRTNGELGGYQGGLNMKRELLEFEGIKFSDSGKVVTDKIYY
ncbi:MAG: methylated-DNA--[protein]-cysteine S-methyltransferase [Candidatus Heimdallarchaeota archaeon]